MNDEIRIKASQNEARSKKSTAHLRVLQYAGTIVFSFSLIALDGQFFGYKISVDEDTLLIPLLLGVIAMFWGYYERRMIEVVRAIKDIK